jgi:hypothetical protein
MEVRFVLAKLTEHARPIVLAAALVLLIDLFLHWRGAPVHTQWVNTSGGTSALSGFGGVAAVLLVGFLLVELVSGRRGRKVAAAFAIAASSLTFVEFFTGSARVMKIGGVVASGAEQTLWPAYAGLALAVLLAVAALNRLFGKPAARLPLPPALPRLRAKRSAAYDLGA